MFHQLRGRGGRLDHRALRNEVAAQNRDAALFLERLLDREDHLRVPVLGGLDVVPDGIAAYRQRVLVQQAGLAEFAQHHRQPAGVIEIFHQIFAGGHQVHEARQFAAQPIPIVQRQFHADAARECKQVHDRVGRTADGAVDADCVLERLLGQDFRHAHVFLDQLHDAPSRHVRQHVAARIDRRNGGIGRQRHAQGFGHRCHRRCGAHGHAVAGGARHRLLGLHQVFVVHLAGLEHFLELEDMRARTDGLITPAAVQHGPAGNNQCGHVAGGRAHHQRRRGLVATCQQDHAIQRIGADGFLHIHGGEIAKQHRSRPHNRLAQRHHRKFQRETACFQHTALHAIGDLAEVRITRCKLRPGVADADDRAPIEQVRRQALVFHPRAMHHAVDARFPEPVVTTQFFPCSHFCFPSRMNPAKSLR